jgi:hypothetical protein
MAAYTLAQAITATGRSRSALIRAIRSGKISAMRDASGAYLVDPSELARVYSGAGSGVLQDVVDDLRRRLDTATGQLGEALSQVRALTDQRAATAVPVAPQPAPPEPHRRWWRWRS